MTSSRWCIISSVVISILLYQCIIFYFPCTFTLYNLYFVVICYNLRGPLYLFRHYLCLNCIKVLIYSLKWDTWHGHGSPILDQLGQLDSVPFEKTPYGPIASPPRHRGYGEEQNAGGHWQWRVNCSRKGPPYRDGGHTTAFLDGLETNIAYWDGGIPCAQWFDMVGSSGGSSPFVIVDLFQSSWQMHQLANQFFEQTSKEQQMWYYEYASYWQPT